LKPNEMKETEDKAKDNINEDLDKWEIERMN
jgi:hypothetical protein